MSGWPTRIGARVLYEGPAHVFCCNGAVLALWCLWAIKGGESKVTLPLTCDMLDTINLSRPLGPIVEGWVLIYCNSFAVEVEVSGEGVLLWNGFHVSRTLSPSPLPVTAPSSCTQFKGHVPQGDVPILPRYLSPCCSSGNRCLIRYVSLFSGPFLYIYS